MAISANWNETTKFSIGDTIAVNYRIVEEGKKERLQLFQGIVIRIKGQEENKTFTVRKIGADNVGVERIFPLNSPWIKDLSLVHPPKKKARRAKLYYLRKRRGKKKK